MNPIDAYTPVAPAMMHLDPGARAEPTEDTRAAAVQENQQQPPLPPVEPVVDPDIGRIVDEFA
jgi:hypothetical protein